MHTSHRQPLLADEAQLNIVLISDSPVLQKALETDGLAVAKVPAAEEKLVEEKQQPTCKQKCGYALCVIGTTFWIYAAPAAAWQLTDYYIGEEEFSNGSAIRLAARCVGVGAAQAVGGCVATAIPACFKATKAWGLREFATSFVTGALWIPYAYFGMYVSSLFDENNYSTTSIALVSCMISTLHLSTLYILQCLGPSRCCKSVNEEKELEEESIDKSADSTAAGAFYPPGPLPLPGSPSGARAVGWAALFTGVGALVGKGISAVTSCFCRR